MRITLVSTYALGHQPFGLASPAAWLGAEGFSVRCLDLAVEPLDERALAQADLIAFYLPMHTATRLAVPVIKDARARNPDAHICAYGLYAPMNAAYLARLGVDRIIGGEFETELLHMARRIADGRAPRTSEPAITLVKQRFRRPDRTGLPPLSAYAHLTMPDGSRRTVGYAEASRGCKHLCRHCPVVPVYGGRFMIVSPGVVLDDIAQQVAAGAEHITFGDPDFLNGPGHAMRIVSALHERWPHLTYDVTVKVEHLIRHGAHLRTLAETGCLFVTSAIESVDDAILRKLDKGHTAADFHRAVALCRQAGLALNPTFVAFTPWITLEGYRKLLETLVALDLALAVAPVQLAIRLLIPEGSLLLNDPDIAALVGPFDEERLCYPWRHSDPRVDALQRTIEALAADGCASALTRAETFTRIWDATMEALGEETGIDLSGLDAKPLPTLSENWYCCAEPTDQQMRALVQV